MKQAVRDWLKRAAKRDRLTVQALASVDAGRLIAHKEIEEWLDSLDTAEPKPVPRPEGSPRRTARATQGSSHPTRPRAPR